jgi:hypothetical protein
VQHGALQLARWPTSGSPWATSRAKNSAFDRYELERPDRGQRFYAAVERAVKLIAAFPAIGPA